MSTKKNILKGVVKIDTPKDSDIGIKKETYLRAGHFVDQSLKYDYPYNKTAPLFENLSSTTITKIKEDNKELTQIIEGINLSAGEYKLIDAITKIYYEKSDTKNSDSKKKFLGNLGGDSSRYYSGERALYPKMTFTLYELTKEYVGIKKRITGKDLKNVEAIIRDLDSRRFLVKYEERTKLEGKNKTIIRAIEDYIKLIHIAKVTEEDNLTGERKDLDIEIILSPIFRNQIESKYVIYPKDIANRTIEAYGNSRVPERIYKLRDFLMRLISNPRMNREITLSRLFYLLDSPAMKNNNIKRARENTKITLETMIKLGLLKEYKIEPSKTTGEDKVIFILNEDFA